MDTPRTAAQSAFEKSLSGLDSALTVANAVTLARTVFALGTAMTAIATEMSALLIVSYAIYWSGDIADGWLARRLGQETRLGAVFDIVSDRACTAVLAAGLVAHSPNTVLVVAVFLFSFLVLDSMLSLSFLCWPLLSPNYFDQVDRRVYLVNWSPVAKALNTAGVIGALALGATTVALVVAIAGLAIKAWSSVRVLHLLGALGPERMPADLPAATQMAEIGS